MYLIRPKLKEGHPMRVAICDDVKVMRSQLRELIDSCCDLPKGTDIVEFEDGISLVDSHRRTPFDIVFLDVQMAGISGLEAGQLLRNMDKYVILIYLTSYHQYVLQSLRIVVFDYLIKPVDGIVVNDVLLRAIEKYNEQHQFVNIGGSNAARELNTNDIIYLEGFGGNVRFITRSGSIYCDGSINEFEKRLSAHGFVRCHQRHLVNMEYIAVIEESMITTKLGHSVEMSVRKKGDCLRIYARFLTRHMV